MSKEIPYDKESLEKIHAIELSILDEIARICDKHNITWFLEGGSVLGALRHKGFIPWDDDIDVSMLRQDYKLFSEVVESELPSNMRFDSPENNLSLPTPFPKIIRTDTVFSTKESIGMDYDMGIYVDIFCYDKLSTDAVVKSKQFRMATNAARKKYLYATGDIMVPHSGIMGAAEKIACRIAHPVIKAFSSIPSINNKLEESVLLGNPCLENIEADDKVFLSGWPYLEYNASDLVPTRLEDFEGRKYPVPGNAEVFLTHLYNNWQDLPPEDKRKSHRPIKLVFPSDQN